jgi:chemotaxis methyl-accepting protein methylase
MSADALGRAVDLLGERAGFAITGSGRTQLRSCLERAARRRHESIEDYVDRLAADQTELQHVIEAMTVQESSFFRDPAQFEALAQHVLPTLPRPVRIWSSGCARGQEPYSLAMLLLEHGYTDAMVIATDISAGALAAARAGRYPGAGLRGLSDRRRANWFERDGDEWSVRPAVRELVSFAQHNIAIAPPPFPPGWCPVIFCRNVLIYFGHDPLLGALERMRDWLPPDGVLFLGYSESLWRLSDTFEPVRLGNAFVYRKRAHWPAPEPATSPPTPPEQSVLPPVGELLRRGELAMAGNDLGEATAAFRQAAYLDSSHPVAHFQLGLALEAQGESAAAARAFRAARTALRTLDPAATPTELLGYRTDALVRLIDSKLAMVGRSLSSGAEPLCP